MEGWNEAISDFSILFNTLADSLPSPSEFGRPGIWPAAQKGHPILCLRPSEAKGLPLSTLHNVFRQFLCDTSHRLAESMTTDEAVAARVAAAKLRYLMGDSFENKNERSKALGYCVSGIFPTSTVETQYILTKDSNYNQVDRAILEGGIAVALREDKLEPDSGDSDVYMQIARDYDLFVKILLEKADVSVETAEAKKAQNFIDHGAPCFLICVLGMYNAHLCQR